MSWPLERITPNSANERTHSSEQLRLLCHLIKQWGPDQPIVVDEAGVELKTNHPTQKPIECMKRPIENNSKAGDYVYEPFAGSGTTIIAAEMTKRKCLAIEIAPAYVDVCVQRWENFTGRKAVLDGMDRVLRVSSRRRVKAPA